MAKSLSNSGRKLKIVCPKCGTVYNSYNNNYFKSNNDKYNPDGYMPICKSCAYAVFESLLAKYDFDVVMAIKRFCIAYDIYYSDEITANCMETLGNKGDFDYPTFLGNYLKRRNLLQYRQCTFDTSLANGFDFSGFIDEEHRKEFMLEVLDVDAKQKEETKRIKKSDIAKWGDGFSYEDYEALNSHYKELTEANPNRNSNQDVFINDLCNIKMLQQRYLREGNGDMYRKLSDQYNKTFQSADLKTKVEAVVDQNDTIGVWAQRISEYTPEEYYKDKSLFKDFDNIGDYFKRFVLRPLKNLQFGTKDRDEEYFVPDDEQNDIEYENEDE